MLRTLIAVLIVTTGTIAPAYATKPASSSFPPNEVSKDPLISDPMDLTPAPLVLDPNAEVPISSGSPALSPEPKPTPEPVEAAEPTTPAETEQTKAEEPAEPKKNDEESVSAMADDIEKEPTADEKEVLEKQLESPTQSVEAYEEARKTLLHKSLIPSWSINFTLAPKAFRFADLRVPKPGVIRTSENPSLWGTMLSGEWIPIRSLGLFSLGAEIGTYFSLSNKDLYGNTLVPGLLSAGPYVQYQANYLRRQWVVPTVRAEYEYVRYNYTYDNNRVLGVRPLMRIDLGLMLFLNIFEPSSAGSMFENFGVKRTYAVLYYSKVNDTSLKDLNLSEQSLRFGVRFEH